MELLDREDAKVTQFMFCVFPMPLCVCDASLQLPIQQQRACPLAAHHQRAENLPLSLVAHLTLRIEPCVPKALYKA